MVRKCIKSNWKILLITLLTILFSASFISFYDKTELFYDYPEEGIDLSQIGFAAHNLQPGESAEFALSYKAWDMEQLGLRFHTDLEEIENTGAVVIEISDTENTTLIRKNCEEIETGEVVFFDINQKIRSGMLSVKITSEATAPIGISVYVDAEGEHLEAHIKARTVTKLIAYILLIGMVLGMLIFLYAAQKEKFTYVQLFIAVYILLGFGYLLVLPVLAEPDAGNHYRRAFDILQGTIFPEMTDAGDIGNQFFWPSFWSTGDSIRISLYDQWNNKGVRYATSPVTWISYKNMALYSPLSYLPQILGLWIGKMVTGRLIPTIYLARLVNYMVVGVLLVFAIKITPIGKKLILWSSLFPMMMELSVGIAPDAMVYALITLLMAMVLRLRYTDQPLTGKYILGLCMVVFFLTQYKIVYVVFCLLLFLIPKAKFRSNKNYIVAIFGGGYGNSCTISKLAFDIRKNASKWICE